MAIAVADRPAEPHCGGLQWSVSDLDALATLVALVLVGRAQHAANVLAGTLMVPALTTAAMRVQIRTELFPPAGPLIYHRDGLLFEIICWLVARQQSQPTEVISEPHTKATQQGMDTVKVRFDTDTRRLLATTIYEYKCTENARAQFRDQVIPAFRRYFEGARDPQLVQATIALLTRYELTDAEQAEVYGTLINERPLAFQAALTVSPAEFTEDHCIALFTGYADVTPDRVARLGDTFPLHDVRGWFDHLATLVWAKIDV
jgi:hypothetical protein